MNYKEILNTIRQNEDNVNEKITEIMQNIKFTNYLEYNVKYSIAVMLSSNLLDTNKFNVKFISPIKENMINDLLLLYYTDIERDGNFDTNDYDLLAKVGFFKQLLSKISVDYYDLAQTVQVYAYQLVEESKIENSGVNGIIKNTINTALDKIVALYYTKEGKSQVNKFLKELNSNKDLLDTLNNISSGVHLESVKDELLRRIAKANENIKEVKQTNESSKNKKVEENKE